MQAATNIRDLRPSQNDSDSLKQNSQQEPSAFTRWFAPRGETKIMAEQETRGVFLPWPLLAIIVTLAIVLVSGLVTLQVQVSNLSTTLLLRDADHARQLEDIKKEVAKETERRELSDLKISDLRERMAAAKIPERKSN